MIKPISITDGVPTISLSLFFVISISMIKDFLEDMKRWKSDSEENNSECLVYKYGLFEKVHWKEVLVGQIIKVNENEPLPADIVLLESSKSNGKCFVETKNLDGETNLKQKLVEKKINKIMGGKALQYLSKKTFKIRYESPNCFLYVFKGAMDIENQKIPLDNKNILLRGCVLKNTPFVIGLVIFNGHHTKIMMNSIKSREKKSLLEIQMNSYILMVFFFLMIFCLIGSGIYIFWVTNSKNEVDYLEISIGSSLMSFFIRFGNWILIFGNFVPISLVVTIETVKFFQAIVV